ncbi:MAG: hypothetical protein AB8B55_09765 [Mariniblastus sp.]
MSRTKSTFPIAFAVAALYLCSIGSIANLSVAQESYYIAPVKPNERIAKRLLVRDPLTNEFTINNSSIERLEFEQESEDRSAGREDDSRMDETDQDDVDESNDRKPQRAEFGPWPRKGIRSIGLDVREKNYAAPEDRSAQLLNSVGGQWSQFQSTEKVYAWAAPDIRYQPLYFEDVASERYGQTVGDYRQTIVSAVHFFKSTTLLPYHMYHDRPGSCTSPLGFCRPGNKVPYTFERHLGW